MDKNFIRTHINNVLKETNFEGLGKKTVGKVRDIYSQDNALILISTDRHSSFDRIIAHIPFKGQILTECSMFWFENTKDIIKNHVLDNPDPNVIVAKRCDVIPIEVVPRAYITGVTNTSLWTHYLAGTRNFGNFSLPEGLKKNQKLETPVLTFTTKSDIHDEEITPREIIRAGLLEEALLKQIEDVAMRLFARGQQMARAKGLILVDTKYEFGIDKNGQLTLIDEIHTPDSSRYWMLESYQKKFENNEEPEYFDKEFLRLWFRQHCDPYKDKMLPKAPPELVAELSSRYIQIYERITGLNFKTDAGVLIGDRINNNLKKYARA